MAEGTPWLERWRVVEHACGFEKELTGCVVRQKHDAASSEIRPNIGYIRLQAVMCDSCLHVMFILNIR